MSSTKVIKKLKLGLSNGFDILTEDYKEEETEEKLEVAIDYLTPAMMEEARTKLNETDEIRVKALDDLRLLIKKEENLVIQTDDAALLPFLRSRKFNVKRSFKLLQNYWGFRRDHRSILDSSTDEETFRQVHELIFRNFLGLLPYRDRNGCTVFVFIIGAWDPEIDPYEQIFRAIGAILAYSIQFPATQVCGYRVIFDARNLSWAQLKMCTPANILLLIHSTQYCFPARYKGFHFLSENKLFNLAWSIIYPLLTAKLKRRIMLHGTDLKPLLEYIHPSVLPKEFGGEADAFDNTYSKATMEEDTKYLIEHLSYGYKC